MSTSTACRSDSYVPYRSSSGFASASTSRETRCRRVVDPGLRPELFELGVLAQEVDVDAIWLSREDVLAALRDRHLAATDSCDQPGLPEIGDRPLRAVVEGWLPGREALVEVFFGQMEVLRDVVRDLGVGRTCGSIGERLQHREHQGLVVGDRHAEIMVGWERHSKHSLLFIQTLTATQTTHSVIHHIT